MANCGGLDDGGQDGLCSPRCFLAGIPGSVPKAFPDDAVSGDPRPALESGNKLNCLEDPHPFRVEPSRAPRHNGRAPGSPRVRSSPTDTAYGLTVGWSD